MHTREGEEKGVVLIDKLEGGWWGLHLGKRQTN